ncbi:hypothetical protein SAMN03159463_00666 [Mesorhizobium sp. NFR06]|uniref:hypothetical protein n=1 Tax=Mesorhizobium sp. NFR06 TaxID=1566290 RepID=UPI0008DF8007|nr:hypothetical protein [Mesorhizobium sp. NFR06]SFN83030.1 hypothetical protein SAMN03159463_00666 [Mesorhizobium sp. NFR06]
MRTGHPWSAFWITIFSPRQKQTLSACWIELRLPDWLERHRVAAGICGLVLPFNLDGLRTDRLNFGRDWLDGFDTGGLNWNRLYRDLSDQDLCAAEYERITVAAGVAMDEALFERIDGWLHESRFTTDIDMEPARRQQLLELKRRSILDTLMALPA